MSMSRELYVEAGTGSSRSGIRLVSEQDFGSGVGRRTVQRSRRVAVLGGVKMTGAQVRDPGEDQRGALVLQNHVLVLENPEAEATDFRGPCAFTRVVLMIAGHKISAVQRGQSGQGRGVRR
jgi:hypothetical protein